MIKHCPTFLTAVDLAAVVFKYLLAIIVKVFRTLLGMTNGFQGQINFI